MGIGSQGGIRDRIVFRGYVISQSGTLLDHNVWAVYARPDQPITSHNTPGPGYRGGMVVGYE